MRIRLNPFFSPFGAPGGFPASAVQYPAAGASIAPVQASPAITQAPPAPVAGQVVYHQGMTFPGQPYPQLPAQPYQAYLHPYPQYQAPPAPIPNPYQPPAAAPQYQGAPGQFGPPQIQPPVGPPQVGQAPPLQIDPRTVPGYTPPPQAPPNPGEYQALNQYRNYLQQLQLAQDQQYAVGQWQAAQQAIEKGRAQEGLAIAQNQYQRDIASRDQQLQNVTQRLHSLHLQTELDRAIESAQVQVPGMPPAPRLLPGAKEKLAYQLFAQLECVPNPYDPNRLEVRHRATGKTVADFVRDELANPSNALFLAHPQGTGAIPPGFNPGAGGSPGVVQVPGQNAFEQQMFASMLRPQTDPRYAAIGL